MTWHLLDARSIWIQEFTAALHQFAPAMGWVPRFGWTGMFDQHALPLMSPDPVFVGRTFSLQRGYSRAPISWVAQTGKRLHRLLEQQTSGDPTKSPLVCTTPFYAPVAERGPGPVIYYMTDLTVAYAGLDADQVRRLDRRLCSVAALVCPNSKRIADYCVREAGCDPAKIVIIPNATRQANVTDSCLRAPAALPADLQDLPRPILGVIGNLADNMDWLLIEQAIRGTRDCSWAFVGPTDMPIVDAERRDARTRVMQMGARVRFTGMRPYGQLRDYARAFDAAILPYRRNEPTFSGSCTRFYEHLAACRPMLGTRGFAELMEKEPLIDLFDTAPELIDRLSTLRQRDFTDGREAMRWEASHAETWEARAFTMIDALAARQGSDRRSSERQGHAGRERTTFAGANR
jgi:hypothetical protein